MAAPLSPRSQQIAHLHRQIDEINPPKATILRITCSSCHKRVDTLREQWINYIPSYRGGLYLNLMTSAIDCPNCTKKIVVEGSVNGSLQKNDIIQEVGLLYSSKAKPLMQPNARQNY